MSTLQRPAPERTKPSARLVAQPIVAVLRADRPEEYDAVVDTLIGAGITSIELTLTTPGTLAHLPSLLARTRGAADVGIGTITTTEEAEAALDNGADYLVTPITNTAVIGCAVDRGIPIFPGAMTPSEVHAAWAAGATAVKIFPADTVGAAYGAHLRGPFPDLQFIPSGGIRLADIEPWFRAGALAVSLGGPLVGDALRGGSLTALAQRAADTVEMVRSIRATP